MNRQQRRRAGVFGVLVTVAGLGSPSSAQLTAHLETEFDEVDGVNGLDGIASVATSPDDAHVYTCGTRGDNALTVFTRDPATGLLDFVEAEFDGVNGVDGLDTCLGVAVSPDGAHLYTAARDDDGIGIFSRDPDTGEATFQAVVIHGVDGVTGLRGAASVAVSPDGAHVYAAALGSDSVVAFTRDASTGLLTFLQALIQGGTDGSGNMIEGLMSSRAVTLSADGLHVYAAAEGDLDVGGGSLAAFARNGSTGLLTFVEVVEDGGVDRFGNPIDGLGEATSVAVSPDGGHVYTGSEIHSLNADDWMAVFERDDSTGELTFVEGHFSTDFGCEGTNNFPADSWVVVSVDDHRVYATNPVWNALAVFGRDIGTGSLTQLEVQCEEEVGPVGLHQPIAVATNPNGLNVYTGATINGALSAFDACANFSKDNALPDMTISDGLFQGCISVSAGAFTVGPGAAQDQVVFRAGVRVVLDNGFQVLDGGRFVIENAPPN